MAKYYDVHPDNPQPRTIAQVAAAIRADALIAYRPGTEATIGGAASVRCPNGVTYTLAAGERFECPR